MLEKVLLRGVSYGGRRIESDAASHVAYTHASYSQDEGGRNSSQQ